MIINSQWLTLRRSSKYSTDQWYLGCVSERHFVSLCRKRNSPLHQEYPRHQAVCDEHAYAWKVLLAKASPQALVESTHSVVRICRTFAIRDAVEEVSVVRSLLPHALHLATTWLEIAKVLFPQPRLFVNLDGIPAERRWCIRFRRWRCECPQYAFCCLACAAVGRCVELESVVWSQEGAEAVAGVFCLRWLVNDCF
jgi:hypothetical protein